YCFDILFLCLNEKYEIIGHFIENKSTSTKKQLNSSEIIKKHKLLQNNLKNHSLIKDYYHIFISLQKIPTIETIKKNNKNNVELHNIYLVSSENLIEYYGKSWSFCLKY